MKKLISYSLFFVVALIASFFYMKSYKNDCYLGGDICVRYFDYSNTTELQIIKNSKNDNSYIYPIGKDGFFLDFYSYSSDNFYVIFQEAVGGFKCENLSDIKKLDENNYKLVLYKIDRKDIKLVVVNDGGLPDLVKKWFSSKKINANKEILCN